MKRERTLINLIANEESWMIAYFISKVFIKQLSCSGKCPQKHLNFASRDSMNHSLGF